MLVTRCIYIQLGTINKRPDYRGTHFKAVTTSTTKMQCVTEQGSTQECIKSTSLSPYNASKCILEIPCVGFRAYMKEIGVKKPL